MNEEPIADRSGTSDDGRDEGRSTLRPDEREALVATGVDPEAVRRRERSFRQLREAGLEEEIADGLRRRLSLPWTFRPDGDLAARSRAVSGLGPAEREWVAASADGDWQSLDHVAGADTPDHADGADSLEGDSADGNRPWPRPTPVTDVTGVGPADADRLAEAGIHSAERLATVDAGLVATLLDLDVIHVRTWRHSARELVGD